MLDTNLLAWKFAKCDELDFLERLDILVIETVKSGIFWLEVWKIVMVGEFAGKRLLFKINYNEVGNIFDLQARIKLEIQKLGAGQWVEPQQ
jgi:hypothetical protein